MPKDAPPNGGASPQVAPGPRRRVSEMQAKLHRWAAADPGRRFDDLFNFVHDPATLIVAFDRVAGNTGSRTAGVDGLTVADVEEQFGVPGFLDDLRAQLKGGTFRPLPARERRIPKPGGSGKVRSLGIPTVADRVVQAALKLVLEPIFEADFVPISYGFRPMRRGWANYFKHAVCKHTLSNLARFVWWRLVRWLSKLRRWRWKAVRRNLTRPDGRWKPIAVDGIELFNLEAVPVTRYRYRGDTIPNPWTVPTNA